MHAGTLYPLQSSLVGGGGEGFHEVSNAPGEPMLPRHRALFLCIGTSGTPLERIVCVPLHVVPVVAVNRWGDDRLSTRREREDGSAPMTAVLLEA